MDRQVAIFLDEWLGFHAEHDSSPGFVVAVSRGKELVYYQAFGDAKKGQLFNIGSQAKVLTAILILRLAEKGALDMNDYAAKFLPWLNRHQDKRFRYVTVEQLLWHGAGLVRDGQQADFWQLMRPFPDASELKQMVLGSDLAIDSDTKLKYSNLGYALLGQILQAASSKSYNQLAQEEIIRPLGLQNTFVGCPPEVANRVAAGYTGRVCNKRYFQIPAAVQTNSFSPVTGWYTTADDLLKIIATLDEDDDRMLGKNANHDLLNGIRHHWQPPEQRGSGYGFGMMSQELEGRKIYGHSGSFVSHRSAAYLDPAQKLSVAILACDRETPVNEMLFGIFDVLKFFAQNAAVAPDYLGRFNVTLQNLLGVKRIQTIGDRLVAVFLDDWTPFGTVEELEVIDGQTLKISSAPDLLAEGERIHFQNGATKSVNYAGVTMWPRDVFCEWAEKSIIKKI